MTRSETHLSEQQLARVEALAAVASYCRDVKFMSGTQAHPGDLIRLSEYVLNGLVASAAAEALDRRVSK